MGLVTLAGAGYLVVQMASQRQQSAKRRPDMPTPAGGRGAHVERIVTILGSPADLYRIWRDLERLPELMSHLESVAVVDPVRSRWIARGPADIRVTWEAEIVADVVSHRWPLSRAPGAYRMFNDKRDDCTKVVLDPTT